MAQGQAEQAILFLERLLAFAESEQRLPGIIETSNTLAMAYQAVGRTGRALDVLRQSLALGRENGYLRIFVDEGAPMLTLLRRLARPDGQERPEGEMAHIRQLVTLLRESPAISCPQAVGPAPLDDPLTAKQLAVLRLVAAGLDNKEIASQLVVALSTVKTHLTNICGKLGVSNRRQAVERALQLNIL